MERKVATTGWGAYDPQIVINSKSAKLYCGDLRDVYFSAYLNRKIMR